jgi:hypothetical protein
MAATQTELRTGSCSARALLTVRVEPEGQGVALPWGKEWGKKPHGFQPIPADLASV